MLFQSCSFITDFNTNLPPEGYVRHLNTDTFSNYAFLKHKFSWFNPINNKKKQTTNKQIKNI